MNINNITNSQNFKARKIAYAHNIYNNVKTNIELYEISRSDNIFLKKLKDKTNIQRIMPSMCEFDAKRWQKIINYAFDEAMNGINKTYIAISNNRPCGILTFNEFKNYITLDCIAKIPNSEGKSANYTGTTLFTQLFKYAEDIKAKVIGLSAVTNGPFDVISKYKTFGFTENGYDGDYVVMSCNKFKISNILPELIKKTNLREVKNSENVNLESICN